MLVSPTEYHITLTKGVRSGTLVSTTLFVYVAVRCRQAAWRRGGGGAGPSAVGGGLWRAGGQGDGLPVYVARVAHLLCVAGRRRGGAGAEALARRLWAEGSGVLAGRVTAFLSSVEQRIAARRDRSRELLADIRTFMTDLKEFLAEQLEVDADGDGEAEAALERFVERLVVRPLRLSLYCAVAEDLLVDGEVQAAAAAVQERHRTPAAQLGASEQLRLAPDALVRIVAHLRAMQLCDLPVDKMRCLLAAAAAVFASVEAANAGQTATVGADDFLPLMVWVLMQAGMVFAEIEAQLLWGLLPYNMLLGESGYYLTSLTSAAHMLKVFGREGTLSDDNSSGYCSDSSNSPSDVESAIFLFEEEILSSVSEGDTNGCWCNLGSFCEIAEMNSDSPIASHDMLNCFWSTCCSQDCLTAVAEMLS